MPTARGNETYLDKLLREGRRHNVPPNVAAMSEAELEKALVEWGNLWGWDLTYHVKDSRVDALQRRGRGVHSGWPDRVWCHLRWGRVLFIELKDMLRPVEPQQARWLSGLSRGGLEVGVCRPKDLDEAHDVFSGKKLLRPPLVMAWRG